MSGLRFKDTVMIDLSEQLVTQIATKVLGGEPTEIKEYSRGFYCYVYGFLLANKKFVFKIDARGRQQYIEKQILTVVNQAGLAVPQVYACGKINDRDVTYIYTIQEQLHGYQLKKIYDELSVADQQSIMCSVGEWLKTLHGISTGGFGLITSVSDNILHGHDKSRGIFISQWFGGSCLDQFIKRRYIKPEQKAFLQELGGFLNQREIPEGKLLHADLHLEHIFVHEGKLSGVIDFGNALSGDPLYDVAATRLSFRRQRKEDWQKLFDAFLSGYDLVIDEKIEKVIKVYEIAVCIDWLNNMLKYDLTERADSVSELFGELLSEVSS